MCRQKCNNAKSDRQRQRKWKRGGVEEKTSVNRVGNLNNYDRLPVILTGSVALFLPCFTIASCSLRESPLKFAATAWKGLIFDAGNEEDEAYGVDGLDESAIGEKIKRKSTHELKRKKRDQ